MRRGPWAKIFHDAWRHEKQNSLSPKAELAWYRLLSWCAESGSDGEFSRVQFDVVNGHRCGTKTLSELVKAKLVVSAGEGKYVLHDYLDHNIRHEDWRRKLDAEAARKRRVRGDVRAVSGGDIRRMSGGDMSRTSGWTSGWTSGGDTPDPATKRVATRGVATAESSYSSEAATRAYEHAHELAFDSERFEHALAALDDEETDDG